MFIFGALGLLLVLAAGLSRAQKTPRELEFMRGWEVPKWTNDALFDKDVFTFARIRYVVDGRYGFGHTPRRWEIDCPDADLNLSFRLQQLTSMKVDPSGRILELTDKELGDFPFIYIVEPGRLTFSDEEVEALRRYLLNGGFLMCDDFWGDRDWRCFTNELHKVFPTREIIELPLAHRIFHGVFDLKEKPQVPGVDWGRDSQYTGITYETSHGAGAETPHYRAILDDKKRIMVLLCHNTDLGDGWEHEGDDAYYFKEFAEKRAYPMAINIVFYALTH